MRPPFSALSVISYAMFTALMLGGCALRNTSQTPEPAATIQQPLNLGGVMVETLNGVSTPLLQTKSKMTLIHFWAPWCFVCATEMRELSSVYNNLKSDDLQIIGVATSDTKENVIAFLKKNQISFPIVIDPNGEILKKMKLDSVPTTVAVDASGSITMFPDPRDGTATNLIEGPMGWESAKFVRDLKSQLSSSK